MTVPLYDAHIHLADPRLCPHQNEIGNAYREINLGKAVVVGTGPHDWPLVLEQCAANPHFLPAIGLHPWLIPDAPDDWQESFLASFKAGARAVGEIGLDCWIKGHDLAKQIPVFEFQLQFAAENNLPVSIHALKATGPLMDIVRTAPLPVRGFHLHAYSGPIDLIEELTSLGAYFSFNGGQLHRPAARAQLLEIRADRLLIETDAPHFLPSPAYREYELQDDGVELCHPANLGAAYPAIAGLRKCPLAELATFVEANFKRFFL
jgi:TatD DNase family protein